MKNISEKLTIIGFLITAILISIAYGLGGMMYDSQTDLYRYYGTVILGFGIPAAQVLMALARIANLPYEEMKRWLILAVISMVIVALFPIIFPKIC